MALAGRLRSSVPLLHKILRSDSVFTQRSIVERSPICSGIINAEFSRNYATAAPPTLPKEQRVPLPLTLFGVPGKYASALYVAAVKANILETIESELSDLVVACKKSTTFYQFMKDFSVPADVRQKAIEKITSEAKISDILKNFLLLLAQNGRLRHLELVAESFAELMMAHKGVVKAVVTTVIALPPQEEKELKETLQDILGSTNVILEQKIDPSILGGITVEFGMKLFDMSIKTRAKEMERFLREPVNFESFK
ncbi:ATP synthase subunit O, mitochondrial [Impatiens glandulifera]|uniref:ATP synthase subunit O, mitochondrial n=1 Tax=Impatiens glandulifera TaxID=253017 RepID=UPI001FB14590|nr:ATP synthase subunit O, mitochondrial [Impatiens glandulifera]